MNLLDTTLVIQRMLNDVERAARESAGAAAQALQEGISADYDRAATLIEATTLIMRAVVDALRNARNAERL